jgi:hypothetical protein
MMVTGMIEYRKVSVAEKPGQISHPGSLDLPCYSMSELGTLSQPGVFVTVALHILGHSHTGIHFPHQANRHCY